MRRPLVFSEYVPVRMRAEERAALERVAARRGVSLAAAVRRLLSAALQLDAALSDPPPAPPVDACYGRPAPTDALPGASAYDPPPVDACYGRPAPTDALAVASAYDAPDTPPNDR